MASSSSSVFHSTPLTSWKYDVFLSFRGTDTRYNFVDHLYKALVDQGIGTFKDDEELPRGETIRPSLLKAIEDSQIAVVVLSENYAESSWCLQELEYIMKCKVERCQIVIPIFYHVDPSEVRKHERKYGEALAKHMSEKKNVESWKKALCDVGNLSGLVPDGPETTFIETIVKDISKRLCLAIPSDSEDLIGMEDRLQDVKSMLAMDSAGVVMVGIWGLGGGGKTTLARALYDQIFSQFDGSYFVKNIRDESHKHGLEELQKKILSRVLNKKREDVDADGDAGDLLKIRLRRKKVLLVLDDVDDAKQLEALAGSHDWFKKGSRIIITTRNQHLLNTHGVNVIYNIILLNHDEAMKLFHKHALRHGNHIEDYDSLSNKVVTYAHGLPLALKVLGSLLCDKDKSEWESALDRLKEIPEDDILETLRISYDGLKTVEKELFLEIACFFRGVSRYDQWEILEACGFHPQIGVRVLIEKALITVTNDRCFDMHDLIQEMGHYIVREKDPQNLEKQSRVWRKEDVKKICATQTEENRWIKAFKPWIDDDEEEEVPRNLRHVIANMKELRWFSCDAFPATSFPRNFQSTKLCYLRLQSSSLKQLWKGEKDLPYLKVLNLSGCKNLISTPNFHRLPCLERIILDDCSKLTDVHPSIGYHENLVSVEMEGCKSLKMFPPISRMKKLETLILSLCSNLCMFPKIQMKMDNMKELSLAGTGIKVVPSSIGKYCTNLHSLDLRCCNSLESIEGNFHLLKLLKKFYISECEELKMPAEGLFDVTCCLEELDLSYTSFKNLHTVIVRMNFLGCPTSIRKLSLDGCYSINRDISSVLSKLSNLQELRLNRTDVSGLHCSLVQLPCLKYLDLSYCNNLVVLPDLPSSIAVLHVEWCFKLKIVDLPTNLKWLWRITLPMDSLVVGDVERKVQSMLQGNAIKDYPISLYFRDIKMSEGEPARIRLMLELPTKWDDEFSGFLICIYLDGFHGRKKYVITIEDVTDRENKDVLGVYNGGNSNLNDICYIYLSFGSLRHTSWWKSTHTTISFSLQEDNLLQKVELVPRGSKGDSIERPRVDTTNSSRYWDKEPIEITDDSKSCLKINWSHWGL